MASDEGTTPPAADSASANPSRRTALFFGALTTGVAGFVAARGGRIRPRTHALATVDLAPQPEPTATPTGPDFVLPIDVKVSTAKVQTVLARRFPNSSPTQREQVLRDIFIAAERVAGRSGVVVPADVLAAHLIIAATRETGVRNIDNQGSGVPTNFGVWQFTERSAEKELGLPEATSPNDVRNAAHNVVEMGEAMLEQFRQETLGDFRAQLSYARFDEAVMHSHPQMLQDAINDAREFAKAGAFKGTGISLS